MLSSEDNVKLSEDFIANHIKPLKDNINAYELDVRMCQLSSLQYGFQWQLQTHREAQVFHNPDSRFQSLEDADQLTKKPFKIVKVNASLNELMEVDESSLSPFAKLQSLDLSLNRITRVCWLELFRSLTNIDLSHNKLQGIDFLNQDSNVVHLNLAVNEIEHLTNLPSLHSLSILHLNENKLKSLEGIQALSSLKELHVQRNEIHSLVPLAANRNLVCLNAAYNRIDSLRVTNHAIENLLQLRSIILLGNPIEADPDYHQVLKKKESLASLDNVTLRRSLSHDALTKDKEGMTNLRDIAQQAFWNQLALKRDEKEEKIRFLHEKIRQIQDEFTDHEQRLKSDLEATLLHLSDLTADPRRTSQLYMPRATNLGQTHGLPRKKSPSKKNYQGITDTGEILRLAATELSNKRGDERPS